MRRKKILFLIGSPNQTSQMHQISVQLPEYDCYFSQLFSNHPVISRIIKRGWLDTTILGGEFRRKADQYLREHHLRNDYAMKTFHHTYDMAVFCSDLLVTKDLRQVKTVFVQEGMTDPVTTWAKLSRKLGLPNYMAMNTAYNGTDNVCDIYCVASEGYKRQFAGLGTEESRLMVTGIPNYDNIDSFRRNDFPYHGYVLVATSDVRETFRKDNREAFIQECVKKAAGRQLIFKLHPNEIRERAIAEIKRNTPAGTLIFQDGNTDHMIANCGELITQYSTVVYTGIALGKKVHSYFDIEQLRRLTPVQNGGKSAAAIADICRNYIEFDGSREAFLEQVSALKLQCA